MTSQANGHQWKKPTAHWFVKPSEDWENGRGSVF